LLRQPCFAQTFYKSCTIFRPAKRRNNVSKIGDAKRRKELTKLCHMLVRFREPAGQRVAGRRHSARICIGHPIAQRLLGPRGGIVIAGSMHMRLCGVDLPYEGARIERTQAHGKRFVLDRSVRLTETDLDPAAMSPRRRKVRVESERSLD